MKLKTKKTTFAEFIGTYLLVFFGTGAIIINDLYDGAIGNLGIAMIFGFIVACIIFAIGPISGAHLNPAVSIAFHVAKRFSLHKTIWYINAQILGAVLASFSLKYLFPDAMTLGGTTPSGSVLQTFIMEFILSFTLMFVIINVATGAKAKGVKAGLAIGFTVLIGTLLGGAISGASMNPARSIGPAFAALDLSYLWIYLLAPVIGAITSIFAWKAIRTDNLKPE